MKCMHRALPHLASGKVRRSVLLHDQRSQATVEHVPHDARLDGTRKGVDAEEAIAEGDSRTGRRIGIKSRVNARCSDLVNTPCGSEDLDCGAGGGSQVGSESGARGGRDGAGGDGVRSTGLGVLACPDAELASIAV